MRRTEVRMFARMRWPRGKPGMSSNSTAGLPILRCRDRRCRRSPASRSAPLDVLHLARRAQRAEPGPQILLRRRRRFRGGPFRTPDIGNGHFDTLLARRLGSLARYPHEAERNSRSLSLRGSLRRPRRPHRRATSRSGRSRSASAAAASPASCVTAPGMPMASSIAEAIAAPTPVMPLSPAPLMPSGLSGLA